MRHPSMSTRGTHLALAVAVVGFLSGGGTDIAGKVIGELGLTGEFWELA